jgi:hypothetical protein
MRVLVLTAILLGAFAIAPSPAAAKMFSVKMVSESSLKSSCGNSGGEFVSNTDGYGCKGKGGSVICARGAKECAGISALTTIPPRLTLLGLLQNGSNVNHNYADDEPVTHNHPEHSVPQTGASDGPCVGRSC